MAPRRLANAPKSDRFPASCLTDRGAFVGLKAGGRLACGFNPRATAPCRLPRLFRTDPIPQVGLLRELHVSVPFAVPRLCVSFQ